MFGFSSVLSFTISTWPAYFSASSSSTGAIFLHGPHHSAQKSTRTGLSAWSTSDANVASVTALLMGNPSLYRLAR